MTESHRITVELWPSLSHYARLARRKADLRKKLADVENQMQAAQMDALKEMAPHDVYVGFGVSLRHIDTLSVTPVPDTAALVAALIKARRRELIGINWPALRAYAKQRKNNLPDAIHQALAVTDHTRIDARRLVTARKKRGNR